MSNQDLPQGWVNTKLENIAKWGSGGTPSRKNPKFFEGEIPWVKTGDLGSKFLISVDEYINEEAIKNSSAKIFPSGSVALAMYGATIGKTSILTINAATNQACAVGQPIDNITTTDYLYLLILNEKDNFISLGKGGAQPNISQTIIKAFEISLPPLAEQKEIVRVVESHLKLVDQIKSRLDALPKILEQFRQSVLASAVSGKLTEDWRENKKIDLTLWKELKAKDVCTVVQSGSTPRDNPFDQNGKVPFLKVYNIVNNKINFDYKPQYITNSIHESKLRRSIVLPNDVLMNIVGPPLGKIAIVTDQFSEWNINQAITLFRADPEYLSYKFLYYFLCEGSVVRSVTHDLKGSVGQVNISLTQCREAIINTPSIEEQLEIVTRVENLFALADQIESKIKNAQERVNLLTQSILAKAFRGELTAKWREENQDLISGENSAEALLKRIEAEKKTNKKK